MNSAHAHLNILAREIGSVCPPFWILTVEWSVARSCLFCLRHRFQIASFSPAVHTRKQRFQKESFSNRSTLESVFEWLRFRRCIVDDSRIRSKTAPFSFEMGILKWSRLELREYRWNGDLITAVVIAIQAVVSFSPPAKKKEISGLQRVKMNSINWSALNILIFIAQLVAPDYGAIAEAKGSNLVEVLIIFFLPLYSYQPSLLAWKM